MPSPPTLRSFQWQDLPALAHLVHQVQTDSLGPQGVADMKEWLGQPQLQVERNGYLAQARGELVGYVLIWPELRINRTVVEGGVAPSYRRQGIGTRLLEVALEHSRRLGAPLVHVPTTTGEGLEFLQRAGLHPVRIFHNMRWQGGEPPPLEVSPSFSLRAFEAGDEARLMEIQNIAFRDHWGFCPNTLEEIHHRAHLRRCPPGSIIFIEHGGEVVGYCWTRIDTGLQGRVGVIWMMGVHPSYRGKGLGRVALLAGMHYLQRQGLSTIELTVDEANVPARKLYLATGFEKRGEILWYEKRLEPIP